MNTRRKNGLSLPVVLLLVGAAGAATAVVLATRRRKLDQKQDDELTKERAAPELEPPPQDEPEPVPAPSEEKAPEPPPVPDEEEDAGVFFAPIKYMIFDGTVPADKLGELSRGPGSEVFLLAVREPALNDLATRAADMIVDVAEGASVIVLRSPEIPSLCEQQGKPPGALELGWWVQYEEDDDFTDAAPTKVWCLPATVSTGDEFEEGIARIVSTRHVMDTIAEDSLAFEAALNASLPDGVPVVTVVVLNDDLDVRKTATQAVVEAAQDSPEIWWRLIYIENPALAADVSQAMKEGAEEPPAVEVTGPQEAPAQDLDGPFRTVDAQELSKDSVLAVLEEVLSG